MAQEDNSLVFVNGRQFIRHPLDGFGGVHIAANRFIAVIRRIQTDEMNAFYLVVIGQQVGLSVF